jgi:hypothetical protein
MESKNLLSVYSDKQTPSTAANSTSKASVNPSTTANSISKNGVTKTPRFVPEVSLLEVVRQRNALLAKQSIRQQKLLANQEKSTQSTLVTKRTDEMHSNLLNCNNSSDMHSPFSKNVGNNFLSRSNSGNINYTDYDNTVLSSINNNLIIVKHGVNQISKPVDISLKEMMLMKSKQQAYHFKNRSRSNPVNSNKFGTQSTLVTKRIGEMHSSSLNCNNSSDMHSPYSMNVGNNFSSQSNPANINCSDYDSYVLTSACEETIRDRVKMKAIFIISLNRDEYPEDSTSYIKQFGRF